MIRIFIFQVPAVIPLGIEPSTRSASSCRSTNELEDHSGGQPTQTDALKASTHKAYHEDFGTRSRTISISFALLRPSILRAEG
jgi:hypothetical protein